MSEYWCSAVRLLDQFTFLVRQLAPEHYFMKRIIKINYSDLTQLWTFCYSRKDTYIKIIAAILDSAWHLERLIQKIEWNFLRRPAIGNFTLRVWRRGASYPKHEPQCVESIHKRCWEPLLPLECQQDDS